jgi:hypothetical protein
MLDYFAMKALCKFTTKHIVNLSLVFLPNKSYLWTILLLKQKSMLYIF